MNEKDAIIKKQNHTLLHIGAELEFIRQHPFDVVLIGGSIENISNIINGQTEPIIDEGHVEGCKVCAGSCKVIDIAAGLQEELDECREIGCHNINVLKNIITGLEVKIKELSAMVETKTKANQAIIHDKNTIIEKLKDRNADDLYELYELDKAERDRLRNVISARDLSIKSLTTMCQSSGTERNKLNTELTEKQAIIDRITNLRVDEVETRQAIEAELSARKEDSKVLMKVVEIVKRDDNCPTIINQLADLLVDYLDAPEGPPETPIDEPHDIKVTFAFLELP